MMIEPNSIIHGNCLDVMENIETGSIDLICADLPYEKTKDVDDVIIPPDQLWPHYWRVLKPDGAIVLFGQDKFTAMMMLSDPNHRYNLIWDKGSRPTGHLNSGRMPMRSHEDMMVFYRKLPTYNPQMKDGNPLHGRGTRHFNKKMVNRNYQQHRGVASKTGSTKKYPKSIWEYDRPHPPVHRTEKPVGLIEELVLTYSNPGDIVLDNTAGSGTTCEACIRTDRDYILIEKKESDYMLCLDRQKRALIEASIPKQKPWEIFINK